MREARGLYDSDNARPNVKHVLNQCPVRELRMHGCVCVRVELRLDAHLALISASCQTVAIV